MLITKDFNNHKINCHITKMGKDLNISIYGGEKPHIGAIALGIPRPSLDDKTKISSSVSVLTITGHKEDLIVQSTAKKLAKALNTTVVVACGIHIDNITYEEIKTLDNVIDSLINELIITLS